MVRCTLSHVHFDLMRDNFHAMCKRLHAALEYLLIKQTNKQTWWAIYCLRAREFRVFHLAANLWGSALDGCDRMWNRCSHKLAPVLATAPADHWNSDIPTGCTLDDILCEHLQTKYKQHTLFTHSHTPDCIIQSRHNYCAIQYIGSFSMSLFFVLVSRSLRIDVSE